MNTRKTVNHVIYTQMHKFLLYINTDIFLPTRSGGSIIRNVIFLITVQLRSSDSTWAFPCGRKWRQDFFSAEDHGFQNQQLFGLIVFFFQFCWFVWHQNSPREVLPAVKQEAKSFKLLLLPVWAVVMCSGTPAGRGNASVTLLSLWFLSFLREMEWTLKPWQQQTQDSPQLYHFRL